MIADYMENGFLENIVDMFKHDKNLYSIIGDMIGDKRGRVRLGTVALVEILKSENDKDIISVIPKIAKNLKNPNPTIRGDTAYLLGIISHKDALPYLMEASDDKNDLVRETVEGSITTIKMQMLLY